MLIFALSLAVALLVTTFQDFIPTQTQAYEKTQTKESMTLEESIQARAEEIFIEKTEEYKEASMIYAMLEYQKTLEAMTMEIGYGE